MKRREFLLAPALPAALAAQASRESAPPDSVTNPPGLEYFLLGNGKLLVGVQWTAAPEAGTQAGLVVMSPEHLNRKTGSLLWHPRTGLQSTRAAVWVDGKAHVPETGRVEMEWQYPEGIPTVRMRWEAGGLRVTEELFCPVGEAALVRTVEVENLGSGAVEARASVTLRPNPLLSDEYEVDRERARLTADGYHHIELSAAGEARVLEREVEVSFGKLEAGARGTARFVLTVDRRGAEWSAVSLEQARAASARYWRGRASVVTGDAQLDRMFRAAAHGFRAVVAESGKMDGGPWGYNLEWVRDASMVASGAVLAGFPEVGGAVLERILTRMVSDNGAALDSSFHRPPETIELDQNGQLLHALWTHWAWTGSDALIRQHWRRIRATADFALDAKFRDARTGLVKNSREFWERSMGHGVREGYELAYQVWNIAGWERAAEMARRMGEAESAKRWLDAAALMKKSFLGDARFSFIENGRFIKRRLANGDAQVTLEPPNREALPPGMPLRVEPVSYCDPDAASVFPILLGLVDAKSEVARRTLESMETLWNQRWPGGGYGRYHVSGEPDSPGPWPFATLFIARAYLEAGDSEKVWRALRWLAGAPGGRTGAWFEYYGPRPIPPLPPVALIPWTWAELVTLVVHHLLGVRPDPEGVTVRPRLLEGMDRVSARLRVNGHAMRLSVRRAEGEKAGVVNGAPMELRDGALRLPRPERDISIEMRV